MKKFIFTLLVAALAASSLFTQIASAQSNTTPAIQLTNATVNQFIAIYADVSGRSALQYPHLPPAQFNLKILTTNRSDIIASLEKAFAKEDISVIPDGDKFVMIVPTLLKSTVAPNSTNAQALTAKYEALTRSNSTAVVQKGDMNLLGASMEEVASIYSQIVDRHFENTHQDYHMPNDIHFITVSAITRSELLYALDTLLKWQGIEMVPDGNDKMKAVKISDGKR